MLKMIKAYLLILSFSFLVLTVYAQSSEPIEQEKSPKEKLGEEMFGGISHVWGYRSLKVREGLFGKPLGIRAHETPLWTTSFELGYRAKMTDKIMLEIGMEFNQWGLQYRTPFDSLFVGYNRVNRGFTAPVRLIFQPLRISDDFIIQFGIGGAPRMFMSSQLTTLSLDNFGKEEETVTKERNGFNSFNIDFIANLGFRWNLGRNMGVYFVPEFRYGLLDSMEKQSAHVQHNYGLFLRWGVQWLF